MGVRLMLKVNTVNDYLQSLNVSYDEEGTVYAMEKPSLFTTLFASHSAYFEASRVLNLSEEGLNVLHVNALSGNLIEGSHIFIPMSEIDSQKIKKKLMFYEYK